MVQTGFTQVLSSLVELFGIIYTTGNMLFAWLSTPLSESATDYTDLLGSLAVYSPFELMFGVGLFVVLVLSLVKFITPI